MMHDRVRRVSGRQFRHRYPSPAGRRFVGARRRTAALAGALVAWGAIAGCGPAGDGAPDARSDAYPFRVAATVEVGRAPHGIRFSAAGDTAYVALSGDGRIAVVDLSGPAPRVVDTWEAGATPLDLIATSDGWLVSQFRDSVLVRLDGDGRIVPGGALPVGAGPSLFTPAPVRGTAWIALEFADRVAGVDLTAGVATDGFPTGDRPYPGDAMWDGSSLFVPNLEDGTVSVVDLLNRETDATVEVCPKPSGGALTPDFVTYLVACGESDEVVYLNTASFEITRRVADGIGPRPFSVAVTADGRRAVVNNAGGSTVSVLDVREGRVVQEIEVGEQPIVVRIHPDGRRVFVSNEVSGTLVVLEPAARADEGRAGETPAGSDGAGGTPGPPTEVVVLGMIHDGHLDSERYGLDVVRALVREIDPDYWLPEIPPNRWERARREYETTGRVDEPRVRRFPEYVDGLFPLMKELHFGVIPTAGWTEPMSDFRNAHLAAVSADPARSADWAAYEAANAAADSAIRAGGAPDDPRWIHTDAYDAAYEIRLSTYNRLFNEELGPGGWDHINASHWANIARALEEHRGEGARVLITYGAGHKGWFLRKLRQRDDVVLLDVAEFLDRIGQR